MKIPKAYVHVTNMFAVAPTEKQLMEYYQQYGYETIEDALENFSGSWEMLIREWFNNTNYLPVMKDHQIEKNIYRVENNHDDEVVDLMDDEEWDEINEEDTIF